jgi:hypothetical protein
VRVQRVGFQGRARVQRSPCHYGDISITPVVASWREPRDCIHVGRGAGGAIAMPHGSDSRVDRVVVTVGDRRIVHSAPTAAADPQRGLAASRIAERTTGKTASGFEASWQRITHAEASPAGRLWPPEIALPACAVARQCGIRRLWQRPWHRRSQYLEAVWRRAIAARTLALGPRICQPERQRPRRRVGWLCVTNNGDCLGDSHIREQKCQMSVRARRAPLL